MDHDRDSTDLFLSKSAYTVSRLMLVGAAWIVALVALSDGVTGEQRGWTIAGLVSITAVTAVLIFLPRFHKTDDRSLLVWSAPVDLLALGSLNIGLHHLNDPVYPALLALPVFYSYVVPRRELWLFAVASAAAYLMSHVYANPSPEWTHYTVLVLKGFAIVFLGAVAAYASERHEARQTEVERFNAEKDELAEQLSHRVTELQAVSQISEVMHSSLEVDDAGPPVLKILQRVLDIPSCGLFVIDKRSSETVFRAHTEFPESEVPPEIVPERLLADPYATHPGGAHFSCTSILLHREMMVVFCAGAEHIEGLTAEDRIVLQAVASELVVAVENSQLYKLTRRMAITDEMTGLYNYRFFRQRIDEEIERVRRYGGSVSLIMVDADDFKQFNDLHGHVAGDRALADLGGVIRSSVRETDFVARYGGEEFVAVLPETDTSGAFVVAEKIREAVAAFEFADAHGERGASLTVSLGLVSYPAHTDDKDELLKKADEALYRAKKGGKDRISPPGQPVVVAPDPESGPAGQPSQDDREDRR